MARVAFTSPSAYRIPRPNQYDDVEQTKSAIPSIEMLEEPFDRSIIPASPQYSPQSRESSQDGEMSWVGSGVTSPRYYYVNNSEPQEESTGRNYRRLPSPQYSPRSPEPSLARFQEVARGPSVFSTSNLSSLSISDDIATAVGMDEEDDCWGKDPQLASPPQSSQESPMFDFFGNIASVKRGSYAADDGARNDRSSASVDSRRPRRSFIPDYESSPTKELTPLTSISRDHSLSSPVACFSSPVAETPNVSQSSTAAKEDLKDNDDDDIEILKLQLQTVRREAQWRAARMRVVEAKLKLKRRMKVTKRQGGRTKHDRS